MKSEEIPIKNAAPLNQRYRRIVLSCLRHKILETLLLFRSRTELGNDAAFALRRACLADIASVKQNPVVRIEEVFPGNDLVELVLNIIRGLSWRESGAVADAEDMSINGDSWLMKSDVEHNIGGFASHTRQETRLSKSAGTSPLKRSMS